MKRTSMRPSVLLSLLVFLGIACGGGARDAASLAQPASASAVNPGNAGNGKLLPVMTQNLYLGAELGPVIQATSEAGFLGATTAVWAMVRKNDFTAGTEIPVRLQAVADEIASVRPELIGLQEAYTWLFQSVTDTSPTVVFDYVPNLVAALAQRGLTYRAVASVTLTDITAPVLNDALTAVGGYVTAIDHEAILARDDVETEGGTGTVFPADTLYTVSLLGNPFPIERGWVSVNAKHVWSENARPQAVWVRFVSTHTEAYDATARMAQGENLAGELAGETKPLVVVGDLNSSPGTEAAAALESIGLRDAWATLYPHDAGFTSSYPEDLTLPDIDLHERIDYVLVRGPIAPFAAGVLGTSPSARVCLGETCWWPSDHAALWAALRLEQPSGFDVTR
jgi:Endonuclease/Exonuclease/phosphatase family